MGKTVVVKKARLPDFLPHGWKSEVAEAMGVHRNTITNALRAGEGDTFNRVLKVAIAKWGR